MEKSTVLSAEPKKPTNHHLTLPQMLFTSSLLFFLLVSSKSKRLVSSSLYLKSTHHCYRIDCAQSSTADYCHLLQAAVEPKKMQSTNIKRPDSANDGNQIIAPA